jgi:hypothetical protein
VFRLLFHPARATRLVQHHALNAQQPSLESVIDKVVNATIKSQGKSGYDGLLQMTVNHTVVNNLIKLNRNNTASAQARAIASLKIDQLKTWLTEKVRTTTQENWRAHYAYVVTMIHTFRENPEKYEAENLLAPPPGQPIGMEEEHCTGHSGY